MRCPDQGQLLLYLEKVLSPEESAYIEDHLMTCPMCSRALEEVEQSLIFTQTRMKVLAGSGQDMPLHGQEESWQHIASQMKKQQKGAFFMRFKKMAVAAAIIMALILVASNPAAQTVAANFLKVFRVQQVDTISITPNDIASIEQALQKGNESIQLDKFGKFETVGKAEHQSLKYEDLSQLGFSAKLPDNLNQAEAAYFLQKVPEVAFTPDTESVNEFIQALGSDYLLPDSLNGQTLRIKVGDSLEINTKDYRLLQVPAPELEVPAGVEVAEAARAMVALPIWPENIRQQLDAVNDWEHTLLIPGENSEKVNINGQDAVMLKDNQHEVLIWQENGMLYSLENASPDRQVDLISIAQSLR